MSMVIWDQIIGIVIQLTMEIDISRSYSYALYIVSNLV